MKGLRLFAPGDNGSDAGSDAGSCIEARAARSHALGKSTLGMELGQQFARQILTHELGVFAQRRRHHFLDLLGVQQHSEAKVVDAAIVGGNVRFFVPD